MSESKYDFSNANFPGSNAIGDQATVTIHMRDTLPSESEFTQLIEELERLKQTLDKNSPDFRGLDKIEDSAAKRDWGAVRLSALAFFGQFSSATLANLTGGILGRLLGL